MGKKSTISFEMESLKPQPFCYDIDMDEADVTEMMNEAHADILCIGHSHLPYYRIIGDRHIVNTGSVVKPKDGDPRGGYAMLTITENIQAEFIRFEYDIEKAAKAIENSPLPDELAQRLRKAY